MSAFEGVKIQKINGGLGRRNASEDAVMALVVGGVDATGIDTGDVAELIQLSDAEDLGINASYDANNEILVHHHIAEFFRYAPDGTLFLMIVPQGTSLTDMCDVSNEFVKALVLNESVKRRVKLVGVVLNPDTGTYTPTLTNGIDIDVETAAVKAQELVEALAVDSVYVDGVVLEGRNAGGTIAAMADFRALAAPNVSVVIANDPFVAAIDAAYANYAAVGAALGMFAARKVNENLGSVDIVIKPDSKKGDENYTLTDTANSAWLTAALSDGTNVSLLSRTEQKALEDKGYIFAGFYEGYAGFYFNDAPTAVELASDYSYVEMNRVWNKAARYVREALIPKMKATIDVNSETGFIAATTIADWEQTAYKKLNAMLVDDEVSALAFSIDPQQNVLGGDPIITKLSITPKGVARTIINELGFTNPFNS